MTTENTPIQVTALNDLIDEREVARILGVSVQTLRNWRWKNDGPHYCKIGKRLVRYRRSDITDFINGTERVA